MNNTKLIQNRRKIENKLTELRNCISKAQDFSTANHLRSHVTKLEAMHRALGRELYKRAIEDKSNYRFYVRKAA